MKELLKQYASYNVWAYRKLTEPALSLPQEKQRAEVPSSFSSLLKTVLHCWDAESIWWQRMKLQEKLVIPGEHFQGSLQDAVSGLLNQARQWEEWVHGATDMALEHVFHYQNTRREQFKQPVYQVLQHVFNHGTYHRGQMVNILRQLGFEKIPATDFIVFTRIKK